MSNWARRDLSAGRTSYTDRGRIYNQQDGAKGTSGVISDSPHQSDDEETTLLKEELRRLRERNQRHTPNIATGRTYNSIQPSQPLATTTNIQFSTEGPVYHYRVVTNTVPSTSMVQTESASEENSFKSIASCLKTTCLIGLVITGIVASVAFLAI